MRSKGEEIEELRRERDEAREELQARLHKNKRFCRIMRIKCRRAVYEIHRRRNGGNKHA